MFPYIPCYCSTENVLGTSVYEIAGFHTSHVTVQQNVHEKNLNYNKVSIHPMLLFNVCKNKKELLTVYVSIHPMLLFNKDMAIKN